MKEDNKPTQHVHCLNCHLVLKELYTNQDATKTVFICENIYCGSLFIFDVTGLTELDVKRK